MQTVCHVRFAAAQGAKQVLFDADAVAHFVVGVHGELLLVLGFKRRLHALQQVEQQQQQQRAPIVV